GEYRDASNGAKIEVINPATGELLTTVSKGTREDADTAVEAARNAFESGKWPRQNEAKRARLLNKIAAGLRKRFEEIVDAEVLNTGKTVEAAQGQVMQGIQDFEYYAGVITTFGGKTNPMPNGLLYYSLNIHVDDYVQILPLSLDHLERYTH